MRPLIWIGSSLEDVRAFPEEALAKAELARQVSAIISERHLTSSKAAEILRIDLPRLSALVRGELTEFSIDQLVRLLIALDRDVEIVVKRSAGPGGKVNVI